jgi:hypothetical protein
MRLNVTETNFLAILRDHNGVPKKGVAPGGRYHVALAGLVRAGAAVLDGDTYRLTDAGRAHLEALAIAPGAVGSRSKMARQAPTRR